MAHAGQQHPNAVLTSIGRGRMVACVMQDGWTIEAAAERFQVDVKTVRKWRDRFVAEGSVGLQDRSSRPRRSANQTRPATQRRVVALRRRHRWGAAHIGHELGLAARQSRRSCAVRVLAGSTAATARPRSSRHAAISATGPVSWSMSTSRRSPASPSVAAGVSTAAATPPP